MGDTHSDCAHPCSYVWEHLDMGYVQGMCDLLAPLLVILDNGEGRGTPGPASRVGLPKWCWHWANRAGERREGHWAWSSGSVSQLCPLVSDIPCAVQ